MRKVDNGITEFDTNDTDQSIISNTWTGEVTIKRNGEAFPVDTTDQLMMGHLKDVIWQNSGNLPVVVEEQK